MATYIKDPQAKLDYAIDWSAWLGDDTIATSSWSAVGVDIEETPPPAVDGARTSVWLSGGSAGSTAVATNTITTGSGRRDERSFRLLLQQR